MTALRWWNRSSLVPLAIGLMGLSLMSCKVEGIPPDQYVDELTETICTAVIACNCEYPFGASQQHCVTLLGVAGDTQVEFNTVDGLSYDGECAEAAVNAVAELGCGVPTFDPNAECARPCKIWHGPMGPGGTCTTINGNDNCKQGLVCGDGVCVDPCAEPNLPTVGQACSPVYGCDDNAWCDAETAPLTPTCVVLPGEGLPCADSPFGYACAANLVCDEFTDPADPTCIALPGLDEECPTFDCADGLYCDSTVAPAVCAQVPTIGQNCPGGFCEDPYVCDTIDTWTCIQPPPAVCGLYGGLPPDADEGDTTDEGTDTLDGTDTLTTLDGTDTGGACGVDEVECPMTMLCIPVSWLCDGVDDCGDNWDELAC